MAVCSMDTSDKLRLNCCCRQGVSTEKVERCKLQNSADPAAMATTPCHCAQQEQYAAQG